MKSYIETKAIEIANQCRPCSDEHYEGVKQGVIMALSQNSVLVRKAKSFDELDKKLSKIYDDGVEVDLVDIGEIIAEHFGIQ